MSAEWVEQPDAPGADGIPGKTLAARREALGWSVEQVADQLKLAVRQIVALEAGDYAALPSPAVVRGFVRAYAKVLKLDPAPLVALIALDTPEPAHTGASAVRRDKPASFSEVRFPTNGKRTALPLGWIGAAVVLVAAAAAAWHFGLVPKTLMRGESAASPDVSNASVPAAAARPADGQLETVPPKAAQDKPLQSLSVPLISVPPAATAAASNEAPTPAGVTPAVTPAATPAGGANALVLAVREDSWIEVRRAKGAPLIARLVKGGSTETFDVAEPVTLIVGKPGAVSATLRGEKVELPHVAGAAVARVNLK